MQVEGVNGVTLEVLDLAPENGAPLVLIHGHGGAKEDFSDHFDALCASRRVIALDLRGHGDSAKPDDGSAYSLDLMAADVLAVADALGVDRFDLLGHSMGGMVARRIALSAPSRVAALIFMDTCAGPLPGYEQEVIELGAEIAMSQGMDEIKRILDAMNVDEDGPAGRLLERRPDYRAFNDWKFSRVSAAMWATMLREMFSQPDQLADLAQVDVPTLVMVGEADTPFRAPSAEIANAIPTATLQVIADAAHAPQFENPDAWIAVLEAFLAELPRTHT